MSETNLPPIGSVWLGSACEVREVYLLGNDQVWYWAKGHSWMLRDTTWHEWQANARCIYDPTAPQPDLAAECERLRRERDQARGAARWLLPFIVDCPQNLSRARTAWPWLEEVAPTPPQGESQ